MKDKSKIHLGPTHSAAAKTAAFIICILMLCITAISFFVIYGMFASGSYWMTEEALREELFEQISDTDSYSLLYRYEKGQKYAIDDLLKYKNIGYVRIECGDESIDTYEKYFAPVDERHTYTFYWTVEVNSATGQFYYVSLPDGYSPEQYPPEKLATVSIGVASDLTLPDEYYWSDILINLIYLFQYWIYLIAAGAVIIAVICFVFLMCSAGRRRGAPGVKESFLTRIPFEIPTVAMTLISLLLLLSCDVFSQSDILLVIAVIIWALMTVIMLLFWCMSLAIRIKMGTLIKNTITCRIIMGFWIAFRGVFRALHTFIRSIPLIWKTLALISIMTVAEFLVLINVWSELDNLLIWWMIWKFVTTLGIIYFALMLRRVERGGREIASGNVDYKVDTNYLILDCKKHAENLNSIGEGLNIAVEERLKSERMKTELITNVSHDIKTPLTSIINYSDLICREECDNERIREYAGVLHNQSEKMKRLIDDLVEASKASSGNLDIMLAECDARVLVAQASGEYLQRLADAGLELVCSAPDKEISIMADGRRVWRVFDNLMNNARKYAMPGTRVYLTLEEREGNATFVFRNISQVPLSISPDELMERFVRGDKSRNTEGNGLGLSIAKSLTELQGGNFDITVDGDLFKVCVSFPIVNCKK